MAADCHGGRRRFAGQAGAERKAAADTLGNRHDIRLDVGPFMGKELAGAAVAALDLVENQQEAVLVAQIAQALQALIGDNADAAFTLHRFDQNAGGFRSDGRLDRFVIGKRNLIEALDPGAEAIKIFVLAAGGDGRQGAAVKGALEGDQPKALGCAGHGMIAPRRLDGAFHGLGAGIGEKHLVGEGRSDKALTQFDLPGNLEKI